MIKKEHEFALAMTSNGNFNAKQLKNRLPIVLDEISFITQILLPFFSVNGTSHSWPNAIV